MVCVDNTKICLDDLKGLVRRMREMGFTKLGRRYWFDNTSDVAEKVKEFAGKTIIGTPGYDFVYREAERVALNLSWEEKPVEKYMSADLVDIAGWKAKDNFQWLAGVGKYGQ